MSGCDCVRCQTEECDAGELCSCCLNAEVERLTTAIQRVRNIQQRYISVSRDEMSQTDALGAIRRALDGDGDE